MAFRASGGSRQGIWHSNLVVNAIDNMHSGRISVHSPHSKPFIEGLFNKLWTKLAVWFPEASVGRFQGENEEANRLLTACQAGHQDPRKYFPMLADVIEAFSAVIEEHNSSIIRSDNYGEWVPHDRWDRDTHERPLAPLNPETEWLFSPFVREWKVNGATVGGKVALFPGQSAPYQFSAPFLLHFHGARVRAYFDPSEPRCAATIVLCQAWENHRAGEVIGVAMQTNQTTDYVRLVMGWGNGSDVGRQILQQNHAALRREVRAIAGGPLKVPGSAGVSPAMAGVSPDTFSETEMRDGLGNTLRISNAPGTATVPVAMSGVSPDISPTFSRQTTQPAPETTSPESGSRRVQPGVATPPGSEPELRPFPPNGGGETPDRMSRPLAALSATARELTLSTNGGAEVPLSPKIRLPAEDLAESERATQNLFL